MYKWLTIVLFLAVGMHSVNAQQRYEAPLAGTVILGDITDKWGTVLYNLEMPEPDAMAEQNKLDQIKNEVDKIYRHKIRPVAYRKATTVPQPVVVYGYISDSITGIPPDNEMAYGNSDTTISVLNSYMGFQKVSLEKMIGFHLSLLSVSAAVGLTGPNDFRYDPKIIYDPTADKYICIMLNSTNADNYIVVGFSATNSVKGAWHFYKFKGDYVNDTTWFDYPAISITSNEFFFTGNKLIYDSSWQTGFKKSVIYQVNKEDGYSGKAIVNYLLWDTIKYNGNYIRNLYPVKGGGSIQGPEQYFVSNKNFALRNDTIFLIKLSDTIGGTPTITVTQLKSPVRYGVPPNGRQPDVPVLATNDGRILGAFAENNEIQFTSTTVDSISGSSGIFHGKISNYKTAPSLTANIIAIDTLDLGYPNISYTGNSGGTNQSIISFNYTGPQTYPGFGAVFYDGSGYSDLLKLKDGNNSINISGVGPVQRWGDYSGSQPDWKSIGNVWVNGIFGRKAQVYSCYMARLRSPYATSIFNNAPLLKEAGIVYPNPAEEFIRISFDNQHEEVIDFAVFDFQGKMIDKILKANCKEGKNIIQFNIASLQPGTYFLKMMSNEGIQLSMQRFVKK